MVAGGVLLVPAAAGAGSKGPDDTFTFTGAAEAFVVPDDVCSITVDAIGAEGGDDGFDIAEGGLGGEVDTTVSVLPGDELTIGVGGRGVDGEFFGSDEGGAGGFGLSGGYDTAGGDGGDAVDARGSGGGGGGASTVLDDDGFALVIAPGAGGAGGVAIDTAGGDGGNGGELGTDGGSGPLGADLGGNAGANASGAGGPAGGAGATAGGDGGEANSGGDGGIGATDAGSGGGGGGGASSGGGGGGGDAIPSSTFTGGGGGGGGGTAFVVSITDDVTDAVDAGQGGDGLVTLTYDEDPGCAPAPPPVDPPVDPPVAQPAGVVQQQPAFTG